MNICDRLFFQSQNLLGLIEDQKSLLHPNHYLILGLKEIIIQRLMVTIKEKADEKPSEEILNIFKLRNSLFTDVAKILDKVDSPGAAWLKKLNKMISEEEQYEYLLKSHSSMNIQG